MDIKRPFWINKIKTAWEKRPIVWLAGVRRSGKTTLVESLENSVYFNCDLPSVQKELEDPEKFYKSIDKKYVIFDEIHQLPEASLLLKIGSDQFKTKRILATGSSTLVANKKFKDSLTGRKKNIHFLPVLVDEIEDFNAKLEKRILHGGLPPALLEKSLDLDFYSEWLDSFYARDIQEIFAVEKRQPFLKTLEYLLLSNGSQLEVSKLGQVSGVSRPTAIKYLEILESTKAITILRPFSKNPLQEIVSQPKVYGFDTGFSCYTRGIKELRTEDCGAYLENLVLETIQAAGLQDSLHYWRTKNQKEVDFVMPLNRDEVLAIECKWKEKNFSSDGIESFRFNYKKGQNWVITSDSKTRVVETKKLKIHFINIFDLMNKLNGLI